MTDRALRALDDLETVDFAKADGLVPVAVQEASSGDLLMLAYTNREALAATLETGFVHFWSRSRDALWRKGETSGNTLEVVTLHTDCDGDAVLARVRPNGPACHTGEHSCFGDGSATSGSGVPGAGTLERLDATLAARDADRPEDSYTVRLLEDSNLRLKKLGEETAELVAALATGDGARAVEEAADLVYHVLVALRAGGIGAHALLEELEGRAR